MKFIKLVAYEVTFYVNADKILYLEPMDSIVTIASEERKNKWTRVYFTRKDYLDVDNSVDEILEQIKGDGTVND